MTDPQGPGQIATPLPPRPWRTKRHIVRKRHKDVRIGTEVVDAEGDFIFKLLDLNDEADSEPLAAFIVAACNSVEALADVCEDMAATIEVQYRQAIGFASFAEKNRLVAEHVTLSKARSVLAKLEGQK